jgi:hypothetical protein
VHFRAAQNIPPKTAQGYVQPFAGVAIHPTIYKSTITATSKNIFGLLGCCSDFSPFPLQLK